MTNVNSYNSGIDQYLANNNLYNTNYTNTNSSYKVDLTTPKDTVEFSTSINTDDGKISTADKIKNFGKGLISPLTSMFSSPKNFAIGVAMIAGGAALIAVTGGAAAPLLVTIGLATGGYQLAKGAYKASTATTDEEAKAAWESIGAGTSAVALSVAGAKTALKEGKLPGVELSTETGEIGAARSTMECLNPKNIYGSMKQSYKNASENGKNNLSEYFNRFSKKTSDKKTDVTPEENTVKEQKTFEEQQKAAELEKQKKLEEQQKAAELEKQKKLEEQQKAAELEKQKKLEKQQKAAELEKQRIEQIKYETECKFAEEFYKSNRGKIREMLMSDGKIKDISITSEGLKRDISIDEIIKPYDGEIRQLYHGTNSKAYESIMKEGFNLNLKPSSGNEAVKGAYLTPSKSAALEYGDHLITARFNGKIASIDTYLIKDIKCNTSVKMHINKFLNNNNNILPEGIDTWNTSEKILDCFLRNLIQEKGYSGFLGSKVSQAANCQYFVAIDPTKLEFINT